MAMRQISKLDIPTGRPGVFTGCSRLIKIVFTIWIASITVALAAETDVPANDPLYFASPGIEVQMSSRAPGFDALDVDGLGLGKRGANAIRAIAPTNTDFVVTVSATAGGKRADYRLPGQPGNTPPPWSIEANAGGLTLISQWSGA